jgi:lysophospholipase
MREGSRIIPGEAAPLHAAEAEGPEGGEAVWLRAEDGVMLRAVAWGRTRADRGTILLFSGRTEYAEKYGRLARDFLAEGYATLVLDWRGQGLSGRLRPDRALGHVERFGDYQHDVAAMMAHAEASGMPRPWFLLAHSMGGAIALRAMAEGLPVRAAAFSAPMWGIQLRGALKPVAWTVSSVSRQLGLSHLLVPGQDPVTYVLRCDFAENALTSDREMWDWMRGHVAADPDLGLGGPSLHWLNEALREMLRLAWLGSPDVPALAFVGSDEAIVDPGRIQRRMAAWPGGRLVTLPGARHEVLMETPTTRARVFRETLEHFARHA